MKFADWLVRTLVVVTFIALPKSCQAPKTTQFPLTHSSATEYIFANLAGLLYSTSYHRTSGIKTGKITRPPVSPS